MAIVIKEVSEIQDKIPHVKDFIFDQIKKEYDGDINPQYHYDILEIEEYYFTPQRNNLFVAMEGDEIIGTIAVTEDMINPLMNLKVNMIRIQQQAFGDCLLMKNSDAIN